MNKTKFFLFFLNLITFSLVGQSINQEPLLNIEITLNGKKYEVKDGDTLNLDKHQIIVKVSKYKTFNFGLISFDYPGHFAFSSEQDLDYRNWTLDGNDFVVMYFELGNETKLDSFIKEMVEKFGEKNCKISGKKLQLGELLLEGKRIDIDVFEQKLTFDLYKIESNDSKSHFIGFQDSKKEDGSNSAESTETMRIITKSFKKK